MHMLLRSYTKLLISRRSEPWCLARREHATRSVNVWRDNLHKSSISIDGLSTIEGTGGRISVLFSQLLSPLGASTSAYGFLFLFFARCFASIDDHNGGRDRERLKRYRTYERSCRCIDSWDRDLSCFACSAVILRNRFEYVAANDFTWFRQLETMRDDSSSESLHRETEISQRDENRR